MDSIALQKDISSGSIKGFSTPHIDKQVKLDSGLAEWFRNEMYVRGGLPPEEFSVYGFVYSHTGNRSGAAKDSPTYSKKMTINNEFKIGETVYLKTDAEQNARIVTGILVRNEKAIVYYLNCGTDESCHFDFEISKERNQMLAMDIHPTGSEVIS